MKKKNYELKTIRSIDPERSLSKRVKMSNSQRRRLIDKRGNLGRTCRYHKQVIHWQTVNNRLLPKSWKKHWYEMA